LKFPQFTVYKFVRSIVSHIIISSLDYLQIEYISERKSYSISRLINNYSNLKCIRIWI